MAANYGLALLEAVVAIVILYLIVSFINKLLPEDKKIPKNVKGSVVSCLIVFGIIYGIRVVIEALEYFISIIGYLNNNYLFFAIMISIFYSIYKLFLRKYDKSRSFEDKDLPLKTFKKRYKIILGLTWGIAVIFVSFDLLQLQLAWDRYKPDYDILYIGFFTAFFTVFFIIILMYLINKIKPIENQLPKEESGKALAVSGIISFGIWSIQLIIFEMYLSRLFDLTIIEQDLRVLVIVILGIFIVCYFNLLKAKFLPEAVLKSKKKAQEAIKKEKEKTIQNHIFGENDVNLNEQESVVHSVESVSYKLYLFLLKKFGNLHSLDEKIINHIEKKRRTFKNIIVGLLWVITLVMVFIKLFLLSINLNLILNILFLGFQSAFFMVLFDITLIFLFNKLIPVEKRIPKVIFKNSILFGGIFSFWIWIPLLFIIYLYFFIWISEIIISNISFIMIFSIIILAIGAKIIRRYARMKNWADSKRKAISISLISLIINVPLVILYSLFSKPAFASDTIPSFLVFLLLDYLISGIFITLFVIMFIYNKRFFESLKFIIVVQLIVFFAVIIIGYLLGFIDDLIRSYHFNIQDIRVPLVIGSGIYLISFLLFSRVKLLQEIPKESKQRFEEISQEIEVIVPQERMIEENEVIVDVQDLTTYFYTEEGVVRAVEGVSFKIYEGETLGLVGETGCGKSVTALSILQVVRPPGKIESGKVIFEGEDLLQKSETEILKYRGNNITMIFQDPLNSINPIFKVGNQISEVYLLHKMNELLIEAMKHPGKSIYSVARERSEQLLRDLNIPAPERVYDLYPHELSGGMRQRIQVAMALACSPKLLIADEPTTALDVTIQNQILQLMKNLRQKYGTSILFITHDLGIISKMCDRVAVMYSGFIVEYGDIYKLFEKPYHPYTRGLIASIPVVGKKKEELEVIPGLVPNLIYPPSGCRFNPRCQYCFEPCNSKVPKSIEVEPYYFVACHLYDPEYKDLAEISKKKVDEKVKIIIN